MSVCYALVRPKQHMWVHHPLKYTSQLCMDTILGDSQTTLTLIFQWLSIYTNNMSMVPRKINVIFLITFN